MSKTYPQEYHLTDTDAYLEWVASEEGMDRIKAALHSCKTTNHFDVEVFVKCRLDAIRRFGVIQASMRLRQLFDVAGPHGRMTEGLMQEIERRPGYTSRTRF